MPEGLSASEVGKEIAEHREHAAGDKDDDHHDRWLSIVEALLLSLVAVLAPYSGYAAAKWSAESSVMLAKASAERSKANLAQTEGIVTRVFDSASFNAWFTAFTAGNANAERLAARRMRPGYRPAFRAGLATDPAHDPNAPPGPSYMPQYVIPQEVVAKSDDARADAGLREGRRRGFDIEKLQRASGEVVWRVRWREHGRNRARTFSSRRDARDFDAEVRCQRWAGGLAALDAGTETLGEYATAGGVVSWVSRRATRGSRRLSRSGCRR